MVLKNLKILVNVCHQIQILSKSVQVSVRFKFETTLKISDFFQTQKISEIIGKRLKIEAKSKKSGYIKTWESSHSIPLTKKQTPIHVYTYFCNHSRNHHNNISLSQIVKHYFRDQFPEALYHRGSTFM